MAESMVANSFHVSHLIAPAIGGKKEGGEGVKWVRCLSLGKSTVAWDRVCNNVAVPGRTFMVGVRRWQNGAGRLGGHYHRCPLWR